MATQVSTLECRSAKRVTLQCAMIVANGVQTGEGRVLNVSKNGCLVEAPILIKAGDYIQMRLFLPERDLSVCVAGAVVQWAVGFRFGVEFIEVEETHRTRLQQIIALGNDPWKLAL